MQLPDTVKIPKAQFDYWQSILTARVRHIVTTAYPGHPFTFEVDLFNQCTYIDHPMIPDGRRLIVHMHDEDVDGKIFMRMAGEILERINVRRGPLESYHEYEDAILNLDLDRAFKPKG